MHRTFLSLLLVPALFAGAAPAETLRVGDATRQALADGVKMPARGMTMERVKRWFGEPVKRYAPVGDPPITRWEYPDYIVYFEHDRVITSVYKHRRAAGD